MVKVGIVGGTGYTGVELLRLLARHPEVSVELITSRGEAGIRVDQIYPNLRGFYDLAFVAPDPAALSELDVVFFATPHGVAMEMACCRHTFARPRGRSWSCSATSWPPTSGVVTRLP